MNWRGVLGWALAVGVACAGCARHPSAPAEGAPQYTYAISPPPAGSWLLSVEATFDRAPSARLVAPLAPDAFRDVALASNPDGIAREGDGWRAPTCRSRCVVRYVVDLEALASACHRMDCDRRVGDAILGLASAWMLRPEPAGDAVLRVRLAGGDPTRFATGLRRDPEGGFILRARELGEAAFTAFGSLRRDRIELPGARLDLALLGPPLSMGDAATVGWVKGAAQCVSGLFGRFPVDATIFVVPVKGADEVVFGRVMSLAGASVALLFGDRARPERAHGDWVVVHELFHLGCPSFVGEGHWLEEGLATYYEPLLRERAGWLSETDLWTHFVGNMLRGLRKDGDPASLEDRDDIDSTYWGGALFAFLADVRIRETTRGSRSLDDAMRAVLGRLGDATREARVADFVRTGDEATGTTVLADLYRTWVTLGENADLDDLWRRLGVQAKDGRVTFDSGAPLAFVRSGLTPRPAHGMGH
ncbi:MAG: hypothetical protein ACLP1X_18550 [Polyangiaceae bacterium]|jgi:hypothetical protein